MADLAVTDYRDFAMRLAKRDAPRTLTSVGSVVVAFAVLNMAVPPPTAPVEFLGIALTGLFMLVLGRRLRHDDVRPELVPWAFCGAITLVMAYLLQVYVIEEDPTDLTYVLVGATAYGPLSCAWRPFLTSGAVILAMTHGAMAIQHQTDRADWLVGFLAALVVGGVLLLLRLRLLRELADAEQEIARRATTDPLTQLLTRQGLASRAPLGRYFLLAASDLVSADATVARIVNIPRSQIKALQMAENLGLGTLAPSHTISALLVFLTYAGAYVLVIQLIRTRVQLERLVSTLLILGGILAFFGLLDYLARDAWLLRWRSTPATGRLAGGGGRPPGHRPAADGVRAAVAAL